MFLGQGGNKRPGPTPSVPPKRRKCGICKQEGKAVAFFHVMFLWHISQTDVLKPSHNFWLQSKIFNMCMFCALWHVWLWQYIAIEIICGVKFTPLPSQVWQTQTQSYVSVQVMCQFLCFLTVTAWFCRTKHDDMYLSALRIVCMIRHVLVQFLKHCH